jgi:hypothetical protein
MVPLISRPKTFQGSFQIPHRFLGILQLSRTKVHLHFRVHVEAKCGLARLMTHLNPGSLYFSTRSTSKPIPDYLTIAINSGAAAGKVERYEPWTC